VLQELNCGVIDSKSVISPYVEIGAKVRSPLDVKYDVPSEIPEENPPKSYADQDEPLFCEGIHFGAILNCDPVIVEFVGISNPSYVELECEIPASSGELSGPCHVAMSAAAHGDRTIKTAR
tara:strand:- start:1246 stop:1608 length:363 start_codon:yes stop_codon:yes gene_type:complete